MAVLYPSTLPAPLAKSVRIKRQKTTRTINFDDGKPRTTNHAKNAPFILECQFVLDAVQMDAFDYFFKFSVNFGVNWIEAGWLSSLGFDSHYFRFLTSLKPTKKNRGWIIPFIIEIQQQSIAQLPVSDSWSASNLGPQGMPTMGMEFWMDASQWPLGTLPSGGSIVQLESIHDHNITWDLYNNPYYWDKSDYAGFPAINVSSYTLNVNFLRKTTLTHTSAYTLAFVTNKGISAPSFAAGFLPENCVSAAMTREYGGVQKDRSTIYYTNSAASTSVYTSFPANNRVINVVFIPELIGEDIYIRQNKVEIHRAPITALGSYPMYFKSASGKNMAAHEFICWSRELDAGEITNVENILSAKWQIE